ncbi:MAG: HEPN domain-containing protein [Candidatus Omnitrophica bacterium]|nr:HEPN domain-containing protein [Candidatus Omnitrophota bacterium]
MKRPRETAARWFRQAEHDLQMAVRLKDESPADACYFAEQASQKVLKAFLFLNGRRHQPEHSVAVLAKRCGEYDPAFSALAESGQLMDQFYIATRYPDAIADPAVPFESYSAEQAAGAVRLATDILDLVRAKL